MTLLSLCLARLKFCSESRYLIQTDRPDCCCGLLPNFLNSVRHNIRPGNTASSCNAFNASICVLVFLHGRTSFHCRSLFLGQVASSLNYTTISRCEWCQRISKCTSHPYSPSFSTSVRFTLSMRHVPPEVSRRPDPHESDPLFAKTKTDCSSA